MLPLRHDIKVSFAFLSPTVAPSSFSPRKEIDCRLHFPFEKMVYVI